jgi:hypothetical protein
MSTLTVKTTHISKVRYKHENLMNAVCELLDWTPMQYCENQFEQYTLFVNTMCAQWPNRCKEISYSPVFRGFWNNEWAARNELDFMPFAYDCKFDKDYLLEEYLFINDHIRLIHDDAFYCRFEQIIKMIL